MGRRFFWSLWAIIWVLGGFLVLGITLWRMHELVVMPSTQGQVQGVMSFESASLLPEGVMPGDKGYYFSTASEWWWWRSTKDEHEQARRLLKIGQMRLRASWDLMALGLPAESVAASERAVGYLQIAYAKGGLVEGQWKKELEWSIHHYEKVLEDLRSVTPDDLESRLVKQEELVSLTSELMEN